MNPKYLRTRDMARMLGYSSDYLLSNRGIEFQEGLHYFPKTKRIDWKVEKMIAWVENQNIGTHAQKILDMVTS